MTRLSLHNLTIICCLSFMCAALAGCETTDAQAAAPMAAPMAQVQYTVVNKENITTSRELAGRVSALMVSEVRPQVNGIIKERLFEEGADVKAGQVLYRIDAELYQATYNNALAQLKQMEANAATAAKQAARYGTLVATDAVSKQQYDDAVAADLQAKAAVDAAKQALETARINLSYTEVKAPVSGRIGRSYVTPGALVTQNQATALATVQQLSPVYVDVTMPSSELLQIRRDFAANGNKTTPRIVLKLEDGSPYTLLADSNSTTPKWIEGEIMFSDITVEQSTGTVSMRAKFDNPEEVLLPGMYVRAVLLNTNAEASLYVPQKAVQRDSSGNTAVYILNKTPGAQSQGQRELAENEYYVERRNIEIGSDRNNNWQVTGGLQAGECLLIEGLQKVRPGQVVAGIPVAIPTAQSASYGSWAISSLSSAAGNAVQPAVNSNSANTAQEG